METERILRYVDFMRMFARFVYIWYFKRFCQTVFEMDSSDSVEQINGMFLSICMY